MSGSQRVKTAGLCKIKQASSVDKKNSLAGRERKHELGWDKGKQEDGSQQPFKLSMTARQRATTPTALL